MTSLEDCKITNYTKKDESLCENEVSIKCDFENTTVFDPCLQNKGIYFNKNYLIV